MSQTSTAWASSITPARAHDQPRRIPRPKRQPLGQAPSRRDDQAVGAGLATSQTSTAWASSITRLRARYNLRCSIGPKRQPLGQAPSPAPSTAMPFGLPSQTSTAWASSITPTRTEVAILPSKSQTSTAWASSITLQDVRKRRAAGRPKRQPLGQAPSPATAPKRTFRSYLSQTSTAWASSITVRLARRARGLQQVPNVNRLGKLHH